jgi:hypothetical protein
LTEARSPSAAQQTTEVPPTEPPADAS